MNMKESVKRSKMMGGMLEFIPIVDLLTKKLDEKIER